MKRPRVDNSMFRSTAKASSALLLLYGISTATLVMAQEDKGKKDELEEVVVTGTRIQRDGYQAPNAVSVVTAVDMKTLGVTTVAEMITQMPNNIGRVTPETVGDSPRNLGGTVADLRGMNTSGGTRTLTLVDSKRFVATSDSGSVDLNVIPSALVSRMETVTGGASATYGSDALAGVVNIILDKELDGVKIDANWGQTAEGDGEKMQASLAAGTGFWDNRAHVTFAYEHSKQDAIEDCLTRDYCRESRGILQNGSSGNAFSFTPTPAVPYTTRLPSSVVYPGQPQWIVQDGLRFAVLGTGNVWQDPGNTGQFYTFNEAGNALVPIWEDLTTQQKQAILGAGSSGTTPYGTGNPAYNQVALLPQTTRDAFFTHFSYLFDNDIKLQSSLSYTSIKAQARQNSDRQMNYGASILTENAYLNQMSAQDQATIRSRFSTAPGSNCSPRPYQGGFFPPFDEVSCLSLEKVWTDQLDRLNHNNTDTMNVSVEANGPLKGSWTWDVNASYGKTKQEQEINDWATTSRWAMATDTILENGQPVCRVNAAGPLGVASRAKWLGFYQAALGNNVSSTQAQAYVDTLRADCAPLNPFGYGASAQSLAYSWPTYPINTQMTMKQVSATASGDLWKGIGAGAFKLAGGVDAYQDTTESDIDTNEILASDFLVAYGGVWSGRTTNLSPFTELELPLLADKPGVKRLMANVAYRWTRNKTERLGDEPVSSERDIESWKTSLVWQPIDSVRVRATYSEDVRAPSARELYLETASTVGSPFADIVTVTNPFVADNPATPFTNEATDKIRSASGGNSQLKSEKATNKTFGIVFAPSGMLQGLQTSVDYYETEISGGIASLTATQTLNGCFNEISLNTGADEYCHNVVFGAATVAGNPYSNVDSIATSQINAQPFLSRGLDYSFSYFKPLKNSSLNFRLMATQFLEQKVDLGNYLGKRDVSGQVGESGIGSFFGCVGCNYTPTPDWQGNLWATYARGGLASTLQVRYVSSGRLSNQGQWIGPGESGHYTNPTTNEQVGPIAYDPSLDNTINKPTLPSWTVYNLHFTYSFADSPFSGDRLSGLELYAHVDNVFNKMPEFYSGRNAGGINSVYYSGLGRQYQIGMHYQF